MAKKEKGKRSSCSYENVEMIVLKLKSKITCENYIWKITIVLIIIGTIVIPVVALIFLLSKT